MNAELKFDYKNEININSILQNSNVSLIIKYRVFTRVFINNRHEGDAVLLGNDGQILIPRISKKQKFYSNTLLRECDPIQINSNLLSRGGRTIKIRDLYFFNAMIYFHVNNIVYKLKSKNGFIEVKMNNEDYKSILSGKESL